jgi:transketolase
VSSANAEPAAAAHRSTEDLARHIRADALRMVHRAKAAHIGSALSLADILAVLYGDVMRVDPRRPQWDERDRFILSKGHACVAVYATLAACGFIEPKELETYGQDHSRLMHHVSHKVPGVEFSTGALGHGLPFGVGKALAAQRLGRGWKTFVVLSDGELDEGSNWEALMFAAHHRLSNLVAIIDYNKLQSLAPVSQTLALEPLADKLKAFGCEVQEVDGHQHGQLKEALRAPATSQPRVVLAHTTKGQGVDFMRDKVQWHYKTPDADQLKSALAQLGFEHA